MIIPYRVDTLFQRTPWANIAILVLNVVCFVLVSVGVIPDSVVSQLVLREWNLSELITHQFLHANILHLVFNMIYLWVFGNAVCAVVNEWIYPGLYLMLGVFAGAVHMLLNGAPVIGASGAISGLMGMYLAIYPTNKISCWYILFIRPGTFDLDGYILIIIWFGLELFDAFTGGGQVAYWAHVGGFVGGFLAAVIFLKLDLVDRTNCDLPTVLELFRRKGGNGDG